MAAFARRARVAVVDATVEHDAGSDPGSNRGIENVAESTCGAPARLGQGGCVRVVVHFDGHAVHRPDFLGQRKVPPAGKIRGIENDSRFRVERAGSADPYAVNSAGHRGCQRINCACDCLQTRLSRAGCHHGLAALREYLAILVHESHRDFCAANIDTENCAAPR